ncbi:MAG: PQQ-binding-like beta-propeller repeat protein [Ignavibacteria bacterium]|jgi:hypothetical protein
MKDHILKSVLFFFLLISTAFAQEVPKWKVELNEPIKDYNFINEGKYLFFTNGGYAWCYDADSGNKIWDTEIENFVETGMHSLIGDLYLVGTEDNLQCYDVVSGQIKWKQSYTDIDQSDYTSFEFIENTAVIRYGEFEVGIDLKTGNELWRMKIDYWGELVEKGTFNYSVLDQQHKMMVLEDSGIMSLFDVKTGNKLFTSEGFDINKDLIESQNAWLYTAPRQTHLLFILKKGAVVIDVVNNKEIARKEFGIDGDISVLLPTTDGCAVMGEEKFVHFNFKTGKVDELNFPVDDIRTMSGFEINGKSVLMVSLDSKVASVDLESCKVLWETKDDDPKFDGYAHRYIKQEGEDIILTYNRTKTFGDDRGTHLYVTKINALTGKAAYKTEVLQSQVVITGLTRTLTNIIGGLTNTVAGVLANGTASQQQAIDIFNSISGYQNIGFDYDTFEHNGNLIILCRTASEMWNPETDEEPGEGVVAVDPASGKIIYKDYFKIAAGMALTLNLLAPPLVNDNQLFIAGENKLIGFDLTGGKRLWTINQNVDLVPELAVIDDLLYVKYGKKVYDVNLDQNEIKVNKTIDKDPFGFHAVDPATGKIYWSISTETDAGLVTPQFSIINCYNPADNRLYFADEQNVYALKMGKAGGKLDWRLNLNDSDIGEMEYENVYAVKEKWLGSRRKTTITYGSTWTTTTTSGTGLLGEKASEFLEDAENAEMWSTYTTYNNIWGATAKRCLRVLYGEDKLLAIGPNAISLIDAAKGEKIWISEWKYDQKDVGYIPAIIGDKILYCADEKLVLLDLAGGNKIWESKENKESKFFFSPDKKCFFSINEELISAYPL